MVDYVAARIDDFIKLMPFIIIIVCIILLELSNRLDKRRPSMFVTAAIFRVLAYPFLIFSPYLFILTLTDEAYFLMLTIIQYIYIYFMYAVPLIGFLYMFEFLFSKFMMTELYMDGIKIKWEKIK